MRKAPLKKRITRSLRPRTNIDPSRVALAALDRIKTVLVKSDHKDRLGAPLSMKELAAQAQLGGTELPPSYIAAMRVASRIGEPTLFLDAREMEAEGRRMIEFGGAEAARYVPFCRGLDHLVCFDKEGAPSSHQGELPIVEWRDGMVNPLTAHFGEWLDLVADEREAAVVTAAKMPPRLKHLLYELGFRFDYPVIGRVETGDVPAVLELIGSDLARTVRGEGRPLFDDSGRALLALNVDDFRLTITLRTGTYAFEAEEVFRWLRTFRDENFFSDAVSLPSHPDAVRDLRRAPPEAKGPPPEVVAPAPAPSLTFRAAAGPSQSDFYILAHTDDARATSVILHAIDGLIAESHDIDQTLFDLYVTADRTIWALTATHAFSIRGDDVQSHPLPAIVRNAAWYGIGGTRDRVLVWGSAALLEFDGHEFVPFEPDAGLDDTETVTALHTQGPRIWMLVCGDRVGAVARFDSQDWEPIAENQVIEASLVDLDVWRDIGWVLDRDGRVWRIEYDAPEPIALLSRHRAYQTESGAPRALHGIRAYDGGFLLATNGGVVAASSEGEPQFHPLPVGREAVRLVRIGRVPNAVADSEAAILALGGPHAWIWTGDAFRVVDLREW